MGNPVWKVGFEQGKKYMAKVAVSLGIGGLFGTGSAYFIGKAKGKAEALSEFEDIRNKDDNTSEDDE